MLSFERAILHGNHHNRGGSKTQESSSLLAHHVTVRKHLLGRESEEAREAIEASQGAEVPQHLASSQRAA